MSTIKEERLERKRRGVRVLAWLEEVVAGGRTRRESPALRCVGLVCGVVSQATAFIYARADSAPAHRERVHALLAAGYRLPVKDEKERSEGERERRLGSEERENNAREGKR